MIRLVFLLAVALAVSAVQCVSACAQEDCGAKTAPCHHHDSSPQAKCAHEIPAAKTPTLVSTITVPAAVIAVNFAPAPATQPLLMELASSPQPPPLTLRI